jgi:hypothetical protein
MMSASLISSLRIIPPFCREYNRVEAHAQLFMSLCIVTPGAEIKSLSAALFGELEDKDEDNLIANGIIADAQIQRFHQYEKDKSDNFVENFTYEFEQLTPYEQNRLREMLKIVQTKPSNK